MLFLPGSDSDFEENLTDEEADEYAELVEWADHVSSLEDSNIGVIFVNEIMNDNDNTDEVDTYQEIIMSWCNLTDEEQEYLDSYTQDTREVVDELQEEYDELADQIAQSIQDYNERMYGTDESQ